MPSNISTLNLSHLFLPLNVDPTFIPSIKGALRPLSFKIVLVD